MTRRNEEAMMINNNPTPDLSNLQTALEQTQGSSRTPSAGASNFATVDSPPRGVTPSRSQTLPIWFNKRSTLRHPNARPASRS